MKFRYLLFFLFLLCSSPDIYINKEEKQKDIKINEKEKISPDEYKEEKKINFCISNNDGIIEENELPVSIGVSLSYIVNKKDTEVDVDVKGKIIEGKIVWDFKNAPDDIESIMSIEDPQKFWFFSDFPDALFVSPISAHDLSILGVYKKDEKGVYILGVASKEKEPLSERTLVKYENPFLLFPFPLKKGKSIISESSFKDALLHGVKNAGKEIYKVFVDEVGDLELKYLKFHNTLRVRVEITQKLIISQSAFPIKSIQYIFLNECTGEVARIISILGEENINFKKAREFRTLGLLN